MATSMIYHVVTYTGPFGYIKPWTAVRDSETYSQQFLTPSIVEGMRIKLGISAILRHRLTHRGFDPQQERTQSAGYDLKIVKSRGEATYVRPQSILTRGVLLEPTLHLAFDTAEDAECAAREHLCLCRNEDVVYPVGPPEEMTSDAFDALDGYELLFGEGPDAFLVGTNRYEEGAPMYGTLTVTGQPIHDDPLDR